MTKSSGRRAAGAGVNLVFHTAILYANKRHLHAVFAARGAIDHSGKGVSRHIGTRLTGKEAGDSIPFLINGIPSLYKICCHAQRVADADALRGKCYVHAQTAFRSCVSYILQKSLRCFA